MIRTMGRGMDYSHRLLEDLIPMKRMKVRLINSILCGALVLGMLAVPSMEVYADRTINEVQESINHQQEVIEGINDEIDSLMGEQDILLEQGDLKPRMYIQAVIPTVWHAIR